MIGMGSSPFFSEIEKTLSDCPLAEKAREFPASKIDKTALDKPIAQNPEAAKNFREACEKQADVTTDGFRELTDAEKAYYKEKLGWTDAQMKKCTINEEGVLQYRTDNCSLEGQEGPNGVKYERKRIEIQGVTVEGVFPVFDSAFDAQLPPELERVSNKQQFAECNKQLKTAVESDPKLQKQFTEEQMEEILEGRTPTGYTWHHNEEQGKMQLVRTEDHDRAQGGAAHTGGKSLWGDKYGVYAAMENKIENGDGQL